MAGKMFLLLALTGVAATLAMVDRSRPRKEGAFEKATFAGGCFWCMEPPFEKIEGVVKVLSGYTGGSTENPTYEEVSAGGTGHAEAVQVVYDPTRVTYADLLNVFWRQIDPTDPGGQFADRGNQYRTAIFYHDEDQKALAEASKIAIEKSGRFKGPIATEVVEAGPFYEAEAFHQDYWKKNPQRYQAYRKGSGRASYLAHVWKSGSSGEPGKDASRSPSDRGSAYEKPSAETLRSELTPMQYHVTQEDGTEAPFDNTYWDNKREGIYVDVVSGEPLFSSTDKFQSGTGWPSFVRPLEPENIVEKEDGSLWMKRTEVRSRQADSHLGHVFDDGPKPTGLRYCINSAALRFIPKEELEQEGYGKYRNLFEAP